MLILGATVLLALAVARYRWKGRYRDGLDERPGE